MIKKSNLFFGILLVLFFIHVTSAYAIVDAHGQTLNNAYSDDEMWGEIVNTSCLSSTRINSIGVHTSSAPTNGWIINYSNNATLASCTFVDNSCEFNMGSGLPPDTKLYILVGLSSSNSTNWPHVQRDSASPAYPILGTNIKWISGVYNYPASVLYSGINDIVNITSTCDDFSENQSDFWTLNGTNLYPSGNYSVGIGTSNPSTALEVIGEILVSDDVCITGGVCLSALNGINFANFALLNSVNTFLENQFFDKSVVVNGDGNFSGNVYINGVDVAASLPRIIKVIENISTSSTTLVNITGLNFNVTADGYYHFRFLIPFRSSVTGTGLKLALSVPEYSVFSAKAYIPRAADGAGAEFQGWITSSDDSVIGSGVQTANTDYLATIEGVIKPTSDGIVQARFASETTNVITIREGSIEFLYQI